LEDVEIVHVDKIIEKDTRFLADEEEDA